MTLGPRVRERRKAIRLSQEQLASRAGLTWSAIQRLEAGQVTDPHYSTLSSIAHVLGTTVAELVGEEPAVGKVSAPPDTGKAKLATEGLMSRPDVASWLAEGAHLDRETFLSKAEECEDEEDIALMVVELRETRDHFIDALRRSETQYALFGRPRVEGLTGDDRIREVFRPVKMARRLANEIRREYSAREVGLINYSKVLFIEGTADDYFVYEHERDSEYGRERHERILEAREAAARELERTYAEALV